jgi:hypothetical protein
MSARRSLQNKRVDSDKSAQKPEHARVRESAEGGDPQLDARELRGADVGDDDLSSFGRQSQRVIAGGSDRENPLTGARVERRAENVRVFPAVGITDEVKRRPLIDSARGRVDSVGIGRRRGSVLHCGGIIPQFFGVSKLRSVGLQPRHGK